MLTILAPTVLLVCESVLCGTCSMWQGTVSSTYLFVVWFHVACIYYADDRNGLRVHRLHV